jgi:hypothetical protein
MMQPNPYNELVQSKHVRHDFPVPEDAVRRHGCHPVSTHRKLTLGPDNNEENQAHMLNLTREPDFCQLVCCPRHETRQWRAACCRLNLSSPDGLMAPSPAPKLSGQILPTKCRRF